MRARTERGELDALRGVDVGGARIELGFAGADAGHHTLEHAALPVGGFGHLECAFQCPLERTAQLVDRVAHASGALRYRTGAGGGSLRRLPHLRARRGYISDELGNALRCLVCCKCESTNFFGDDAET